MSSKKRVPPVAATKRPSRFDIAPVKAPFSWPKSSLSISSLGIEDRFIAINGFFFRVEL